jgi:hypothetical protein
MLRGMGFDNTTSLYVASGKIYNAEKYMTPLRRLFPFLQTKHALVTPEELAQFKVPFSLIIPVLKQILESVPPLSCLYCIKKWRPGIKG